MIGWMKAVYKGYKGKGVMENRNRPRRSDDVWCAKKVYNLKLMVSNYD